MAYHTSHLNPLRCGRGCIALTALLIVAPLTASAGDPPLFSDHNPGAPAGIQQYGQFVGRWTCTPASLQPDGSWKASDARPTWTWHYVLSGQAIQDVWIPDPERSPPGAAMGTNLRVYDAEHDRWDMVWTTETMGAFQHFSAQMQDGEIVMHGGIPEGQRKAHLARITFHNISDNHYDWKYEASEPDDGETWQLQMTLSCDRAGRGP
jgi:hypothetical protein